MSIRQKKLLLKVELVELECDEADELFDEYNEKFMKDFKHELDYVNTKILQNKSPKNTAKKTENLTEIESRSCNSLTRKIYRNLAKILHPDVSDIEGCEKIFKKIVDSYEKDDPILLIKMSNTYGIDLPPLSSKDCDFIETKIALKEKQIATKKNTIAWVWGNNHEQGEEAKKKIYKILKLKEDEYLEWFNAKVQ